MIIIIYIYCNYMHTPDGKLITILIREVFRRGIEPGSVQSCRHFGPTFMRIPTFFNDTYRSDNLMRKRLKMGVEQVTEFCEKIVGWAYFNSRAKPDY